MTGQNGRLRFGPQEWIAIFIFAAGVLSAILVDWRHTTERLLILEQNDQHQHETLDEIKEETKLIPRIDQRLMAIENAAERRTAQTP